MLLAGFVSHQYKNIRAKIYKLPFITKNYPDKRMINPPLKRVTCQVSARASAPADGHH
jgi:hypothetical protein